MKVKCFPHRLATLVSCACTEVILPALELEKPSRSLCLGEVHNTNTAIIITQIRTFTNVSLVACIRSIDIGIDILIIIHSIVTTLARLPTRRTSNQLHVVRYFEILQTDLVMKFIMKFTIS